MASVTLRFNRSEEERLLRLTSGPTGRYLAGLAVKVETSAKTEVKRMHAIDTGRMWGSITWRFEEDRKGLAVIIGTNVEYAIYVHEGTSRMPARPFLTNALRIVLGQA